MYPKRRLEEWKTAYCVNCSVATGQIIEIPHRRISKCCAICGRTVQELQSLKQSEELTEAFWRLFKKAKDYPNRKLRVRHNEYRDPQPLLDHLQHIESNKNYVFLTALESILKNPTEYEKFQAFVQRDREKHYAADN